MVRKFKSSKQRKAVMSKLGYGIRRGTFYKITKMKQPINKIKFLKKNSKKFYILAKSEEIQPIE